MIGTGPAAPNNSNSNIGAVSSYLHHIQRGHVRSCIQFFLGTGLLRRCQLPSIGVWIGRHGLTYNPFNRRLDAGRALIPAPSASASVFKAPPPTP